MSDVADPRQGLATGNNDKFLRFWNEVSIANTSVDCESHEDSSIRTERWYPCQKGGPTDGGMEITSILSTGSTTDGHSLPLSRTL